MCGICGEVNLAAPPDAEGVRRAAAAIAHRGPDSDGFFTEGPAALGHRRLAILDLATGDQPMTRDGVTIVFNGEAYDFAPLRDDLRKRGHPFTTRSDTEVVLRAYLEWGEEFAERVHGMFALALWDARTRKLVLARDRLGKKPLYLHVDGQRCVFGSELKALLAHGGVPRELNPEAFVQYLACEYVPAPGSILRGVQKLPAAHVAVFDGGGLRLRRFWDIPLPEARAPEGARGELLRLLDAAVAKRLVADVPVGVFLSGGIDSTSIAALAARHKKPLRTFSIGFTEASFDESPWAQLASQRLGTEHVSQKFSGQECLDLLPAAAAQLDEPFADPSFLPTLLLSRFTRRHVKVALAGDGGDELFGGYDPFLAHRPAALFAHVPRSLRALLEMAVHALPSSSRNMSLDFRLKQFMRGVDAPPTLRHASWIAALLPGELARLLHPDLRPLARADVVFRQVLGEARGAPGSMDEALRYYLTRYLADDILVKADRASMAASLELRAPYLDTAVVEFAARLPWRTKVSWTRTKIILKEALRGVVPDEILRRPKKGFGIPVAAWIRGPLRPLFEELLSENALRDAGVFEPAAVRALLEAHFAGRADLRKPLWTVLMFQLWRKSFARSIALRSAA
ncbi:MAG TPA: asparagine synthase (glutamine-hydrolyzing) [Myxococcales bacterium]|nr:asparagine synthase (glutamine-hydrolyzing) [Myxococcales bacterium]